MRILLATAMEKSFSCSVCERPIVENYCSNCGQKANLKQTNLWNMITDFVANVFSMEKSVFAAMLGLLRNPKRIIDNYWMGFRGYYPTPGKLFFYGLAFAALHVAYVNDLILGLTLDINVIQAQFFFWALFFPMLIITSVVSFALKKQPFTRHIISLLYIGSSFFIIITIIQDSITLIFDRDYTDILGFLIFLLCVWVWNAIAFCPARKYLQIIMYTVVQLIVFAILVAFCMWMIHLSNPESLKLGEG